MNIKKRDSGWYIFSNAIAFSISGWLCYFLRISQDVEWLEVMLPVFFVAGAFDATIIEGARDIYRFSRMKILKEWFFRSIFYSLILIVFLEKVDISLGLFIFSWFIFLSVPAVNKLIFLTWSINRLRQRKIFYKTMLIGSGEKAQRLVEELNTKSPSLGQKFVGSLGPSALSGIPYLGQTSRLGTIVTDLEIEEVIFALEKEQYTHLDLMLNSLRSLSNTLLIRITPDSYDFLMGHVKMDAVYGVALMELPSGRMMIWQQGIKRSLDVIVSVVLLIILAPVILFISIKTALSSPGPILYRQQRIGRFGVPFAILKFRSMALDAESQGPSLSFDGDPRCTPWGNFMRKWRLDEIPQFMNVIQGEMSIVGPRPERKYFIDQIKQVVPYYSRILTVRPGITSWGQVKYGYASNLDQIMERLKFDLIYVENLSLTLDIKIICYTILVLFQGKGK